MPIELHRIARNRLAFLAAISTLDDLRDLVRSVNDMARRLEQLLLTDQQGYFGVEGANLKLAQHQTDRANRQAELRKKWTDQATKEADFVSQRKTQLGEIEKQLRKIKGEVDEMLARIAAVTPDEVREVAAEILGARPSLSVIGPLNDRQAARLDEAVA